MSRLVGQFCQCIALSGVFLPVKAGVWRWESLRSDRNIRMRLDLWRWDCLGQVRSGSVRLDVMQATDRLDSVGLVSAGR